MENHLFKFVNDKHDGITNQHMLLSIKSSEPNNKRANDNGFLHSIIRKKKLVWLLFLLSFTIFIAISICLHYLKEVTQPKELYFKQEVNNEEVATEIKSEINRPKKDDSFIVQDASHANYRLALKMMSETDFWVEGTIEVENRSEKNWMDLQFYFIPNVFQAANIKEITINGEKMKYDLYDDSLRIHLYQALQIGKKLNVHFSYTLTPPKDELRLFRSDKSISLAEWYPMLCTYLNGWQKSPYEPSVESFFTGYSDFSIQFDLLDGYTLTSSAEEDPLVNQRTGNLEAKKIKEFYISLIKEPVIKTKKVNQTEIRVIGSKENEPSQNYLLDITSEAFEFFNSRIGKYPYKQLDVVYGNNYNLEFPGIVTVSDQGEIAKQKHPTIHEVAHQWFYGLVSNDTYNDGWLDEGLTEFSTALFFLTHEKKTIEESFEWVNWLYNERTSYPSNLPLEDYKQNGGTVAYLYAQPGIKLWEVMGEEDPSGNKALEFLSKYFHSYAYQIVNTEEFVRFMKLHYEVDDSYFDEWLETPPEYVYWKL